MIRRIAVVVVVAVVGLVALRWDMIGDDDVRRDVARLQPTWQVLDVDPGEGDSDTVYMLIGYRESSDGPIHHAVWQYMRDRDTGRWYPGHRATCPPELDPRVCAT